MIGDNTVYSSLQYFSAPSVRPQMYFLLTFSLSKQHVAASSLLALPTLRLPISTFLRVLILSHVNTWC